MSAPRRTCPVCHREIAVVSGRYARHDPPHRRSVLELVSCPGSLSIAPLLADEALFAASREAGPGQQTLF